MFHFIWESECSDSRIKWLLRCQSATKRRAKSTKTNTLHSIHWPWSHDLKCTSMPPFAIRQNSQTTLEIGMCSEHICGSVCCRRQNPTNEFRSDPAIWTKFQWRYLQVHLQSVRCSSCVLLLLIVVVQFQQRRTTSQIFLASAALTRLNDWIVSADGLNTGIFWTPCTFKINVRPVSLALIDTVNWLTSLPSQHHNSWYTTSLFTYRFHISEMRTTFI